ncbi:hypothetical protein HYPSUDRAFT_35414 [Hypholoma sublateritium FD-334 SS-4]|uniref:U4/U6.U5 small nuclear ribonucleoprotein 27kDa protein domain-containing protein n=1 Tax=Hypholoma sublateritium (strain FD-334 SS-4) TaxID=945553 RepID=A0A0D2MU18_HYPSF|nr:hypothetical protein HYPSUDRAFT_35414 [Hypholoma sublateritium FD-334 SS-4]
MSSRPDPRRRDRSWERDDKDRDRYSRGGDGRRGGDRGRHHRDEPRRRPSSRSRSPRRDRDDRRASDRRDRDRDYRREDDRRPDTRHDQDRERERERERELDRRPDERRRADDTRDSRKKDEKDGIKRDDRHTSGQDSKNGSDPSTVAAGSSSQLDQSKQISSQSPHPNVDPGTPKSLNEDGEAMEEENDDDAAMMAMMGVTGFGSTKGKQVPGNQEGSADVKKARTWRQYMNRRGGFNRPLDKIK